MNATVHCPPSLLQIASAACLLLPIGYTDFYAHVCYSNSRCDGCEDFFCKEESHFEHECDTQPMYYRGGVYCRDCYEFRYECKRCLEPHACKYATALRGFCIDCFRDIFGGTPTTLSILITRPIGYIHKLHGDGLALDILKTDKVKSTESVGTIQYLGYTTSDGYNGGKTKLYKFHLKNKYVPYGTNSSINDEADLFFTVVFEDGVPHCIPDKGFPKSRSVRYGYDQYTAYAFGEYYRTITDYVYHVLFQPYWLLEGNSAAAELIDLVVCY